MKLISTELGEDWIELTYAEGQNADDASKFLIFRLPREVDHSKSPAWNRYWALNELREFIDAQQTVERDISEGRNRG